MSLSNPHRRKMLHLLATSELAGVAPGEPDTGAIDWDALLVSIRQHRLGPLLHWRLRHNPLPAAVPAFVLQQIESDFRQHTRRSLILRGQIIALQQALSQQGIPTVFLKGAYLALHAYPHPAMRPLRDLDILVPRERSLEAFDALGNLGFKRLRDRHGHEVAGMNCTKHLPGLLSPAGNVLVEIHTRLVDQHVAQAGPGYEPADDPSVWGRLIQAGTGRERVSFLSPTDQLLHLIVHAVFDHRLNNGPLTLADIGYLLSTTTIDWPVFWRMVADGGWLRGAWLLLQAVDRLHCRVAIVAPAFVRLPEPPAELIDAIAFLMLCDTDHRGDVNLDADLLHSKSSASRIKLILGRLFPSPRQLALGTTRSGSFLNTRNYIGHWRRLASVRLPAYLASRRHAGVSEADDLSRLEDWLADGS